MEKEIAKIMIKTIKESADSLDDVLKNLIEIQASLVAINKVFGKYQDEQV